MNSLLKKISNGFLFRVAIVFLITFLLYGCADTQHPELKTLTLSLDNDLEKLRQLLELKNVSDSIKQQKLDSIIIDISQLKEVWEHKVDSLRNNLSEEQINNIEDESREKMLQMEKLLNSYYPDYNKIIDNE